MDNKAKRILFFLCFSIILALCIVGYLKCDDTITKTFASGIGTSIIASLIFSLVFYVFIEKKECKKCSEVLKDSEFKEIKNIMTNNEKSIQQRINNINFLTDSGLKSIRKKHFYESGGKFWIELINEAEEKLDLMGHSLSKWLDDEYKDAFINKLLQLAKNKKDVRIIILKPDGDSLSRMSDQLAKNNYKQKVEKTLNVIRTCVIDKLDTPDKKYIKIKEVEKEDINYMMINTGSSVCVSPFFVKNSSYDSILIVLDRGSEFGKSFCDDFNNFFEDGK